MHLAVGARLGPYEVEAPAGSGGMGVVYRARDTRLDRLVALKLLLPRTVSDPHARARFEREAKIVSQLDHPHICTLFDVGTHEGMDFLVMEYVDGETLAARLGRGPLPVDEALACAIQIADALDTAHRRGIVHRDLKPGNVMLARGAVKLLDFGLAKPAPAEGYGTLATVSAPALSAGLTAHGTIVGTFLYMAPEQIEGREADPRADLWAFGCLLYEMLTGRRAFEAPTQAGLIGAIIGGQPPALDPAAVPPLLGRIVETCLSKDPADRLQNAHDLRLQLQWIEEARAHTRGTGIPPPPQRRERLVWAGALAVVGAVAWTGGVLVHPPRPSPSLPILRLQHYLAEGQQFTSTGRRILALAPDGSRLAFIANNQLHVRELSRLSAAPLPGTNEAPADPVFSPDGEWIAYFVPSGNHFRLKKIAVAGGPPVELASTGWPFGAHWRHGRIVFGQNHDGMRGIYSVPETGGEPHLIAKAEAQEVALAPFVLDDGEHVVFSIRPADARAADEGQVVVQRIGGRDRRELVRGTAGRVAPGGGHLLYVTGRNLFAVPFDVTRLVATGTPRPVLQGISVSPLAGAGIAQFSVSDTGMLAYWPGQADAGVERAVVWVDGKGQEERIPMRPREYYIPRVSPDGTRIAVYAGDESDLWVHHLARGTSTRVTFGKERAIDPQWAPDGRSIFFADGRRLLRTRADGTAPPETLLEFGVPVSVNSISPDGRFLVFRAHQKDTGDDLMVLSLDSSGQPARPLVQTPHSERQGMISPDGRWLAYASNESGRPEVYCRPFPNVEAGRWIVSTEGGDIPRWSGTGRDLFFLSSGGIWRVAVNGTGREPAFGRPEQVLPNAAYYWDYDVSNDGRRLLLTRFGTQSLAERPSLVIVSNWLEEIRQLAPRN